jgi:acetyl esterase/lipase
MTLSKQTTYAVQIEDVEYLRHGDKPFQARLFKPQGDGPFPVMIELHGGAWVNGTRENGNVGNEALAKNGIIVAALDFRVPPEASYPASFQDIHYGIRWAKAHAAGWKGNTTKIGAMGTSSGAHQAMLLGMRPFDSRYAALSLTNGASEVDGTLGCVIMVSPVIDPLGRYHYAKGIREDVKPPESVGERTVQMHDMYWVTEEAMAEAAPARALARGERGELPPTLCLVREYEAAHPRPDLLEFVSQYQNAGGQIDLTVFEGEGEGVLRDLSTDVAQQALEQMTSFIHRHLG